MRRLRKKENAEETLRQLSNSAVWDEPAKKKSVSAKSNTTRVSDSKSNTAKVPQRNEGDNEESLKELKQLVKQNEFDAVATLEACARKFRGGAYSGR